MRTSVLLLFTMLLSSCTQLFFQPHGLLIDTPEHHGIEYQTENFEAMDGTMLNAWFLPAKGEAKATVLFLHGNAENISTHFRSIMWMPAKGFNVLALDYRGYGASEGKPSFKGVQLDIDAAMRNLLTHEGVDPDRIVIFGQSLGGALVIHYVAHSAYQKNIRALVIDSAFYDYRQIVKEKLANSSITWAFQWLPWLTIDNTYSPAASIAAISPTPLLLIHGDQDVVVPQHHSKQLYEHAKEPKKIWLVAGSGHTQSLNKEELQEKLTEYLLRYAE